MNDKYYLNGGIVNPIEALFDCYFDSRGCDDDRVEEAYEKVCRALVDVDPFQIEEIMGAVTELCMEHERTGFTGGIKTGMRLKNHPSPICGKGWLFFSWLFAV